MPRKRLFSREQVLEAINQSVRRHGRPPTLKELQKALGVGSTRTVYRYLEWLREERDIDRWPGARGLRLLRVPKKGFETKAVPVIGEVPAGPMMLADENIETWIRVPKDFLKSGGRFFFLRVRGDSMNRARVAGTRIDDGDLVLVRQQPTAEPGEVVVALVDGEATIKRFERGQGYYLLKPESANPAHKPIIATQDFSVAGVVRQVLKKGSKLIS